MPTTHRTRKNVAAIMGLTSALDDHTSRIRIAMRSGYEAKALEALESLQQDLLCLIEVMHSEAVSTEEAA